jgi:hypothetical protein
VNLLADTATAAHESPWRPSWRNDPAVRLLADDHYSRQNPGADGFVPPGKCLVLKTATCSVPGRPWAAWVTSWPKAEFVQHAWAGAWINQLFRREGGPYLASDLITWAVAHTRAHWPAVPKLGIVTFVDEEEIKGKEVPGWCYRRAGGSHVGFTAGGLWAFQQLPDRRIGRRSWPMPLASPVPGGTASLFELEAS